MKNYAYEAFLKQRAFERRLIQGLIALSILGFMASKSMAADGVRYCNPEKSKPCGNSCIQPQLKCHKPPGIAVAGIRDASAKDKNNLSGKK